MFFPRFVLTLHPLTTPVRSPTYPEGISRVYVQLPEKNFSRRLRSRVGN